jgi:hypothetical protein
MSRISNSTNDPQGAPTISCAAPNPSKVHKVTVAAGNDLIFAPNIIEASIGDTIEFNFLALNHTLTQSLLEVPCTNVGGFSTGFNQFNPKNASGRYLVEYAVKTLDPQWFFCAQTKNKSHCHAGMIFALNPGSQMSRFMSAATETFLPGNAVTTPGKASSMSATGLVSSSIISGTSTSSLIPSSTRLSSAPNNFTGSAGREHEVQRDGIMISVLGLTGAILFVL